MDFMYLMIGLALLAVATAAPLAYEEIIKDNNLKELKIECLKNHSVEECNKLGR